METLQGFAGNHGVLASSKSYVREYPLSCKPTSITTFSGKVAGVKRDFPLNCGGPTSGKTFSGKKRRISEIISPENYVWWRKVSATKSKPKTHEKINKTGELIVVNNGGNSGGGGEREKIRALLGIFRKRCEELSRVSMAERGTHRIDFRAMVELKKQGIVPNQVKRVIGSISGVEIGDRFVYRVELMIVGLHSRSQNGIDFMMTQQGLVATCIVATEGYPDKINDDDEQLLSYVGEGGIYGKEDEHPKDQKMERGNLALRNSEKFGLDVRVVKGVRFGTRYGDLTPKITYVYDGLYRVVECKAKRGLKNNLMFEFKLKRKPGQPPVACHRLKIV